MCKKILASSLMAMLTLAGCSANHSASSAQEFSATGGVDPRIPSLVITGKRMTLAEKDAYDRDIEHQIARYKAVE